jgi:hypothetical protein
MFPPKYLLICLPVMRELNFLLWMFHHWDDFYIGKYIYRIAKGEADILVDDVKASFTTIADADLHIKNKLKGNIPK